MTDIMRKGTGLGTDLDRAPAGMKAVEIDPKKIGRDGYLMIGQKEALERWMNVLMNASTRTPDKNEKRIIDDILAGMFEDMERIEFELAKIAQTRGALKVIDEFEVH